MATLVRTHVQGLTSGGNLVPTIAPTAGNLLVLAVYTRNTTLGPTSIPGWTTVPPGVVNSISSFTRDAAMFYRVAQVGDTSWSVAASSSVFVYTEWSDVAGYDTSTGASNYTTSFNYTSAGPVTTSGPALILGFNIGKQSGSGANVSLTTPTSPAVEVYDSSPGDVIWLAYRIEASAGTYSIAGTGSNTNGIPPPVGGITVAFLTSAPPIADFTVADRTVIEGGAVAFTDLSTNNPTSWAWDFGDGGTSTSQNPSHVYSAAGTYTVSLTATNTDGSDTETKTAYITVNVESGYEPPRPAGVLLEIYAASPGSARWDHANWDEAVWSQAGWQDVTPQGISVDITWGSRQPELGILSKPEAADWRVAFYDPNRLLDPANADSPYQADLIPGLPIRVSHRGTVVRVGYATGISFHYAKDTQNGFIRATDNVSRLANAEVPSDVTLSDTLYARAVDAIAAAGLSVRVLEPLGTDPAIAPWLTGVNKWSAWDWIRNAAEQVNYIPIVDRLGDLSFRPWAAPMSRGRSMDSPELVDLTNVSDYIGQYSVVRALDDDGVTIVERALTPPPRYGARTYERSDPTIDAGDWADAVLADRALPGLRWVPGIVRPLTADSAERFATIEAVELVSMAVPEQASPVSATAIVVGGQIHIRAKREDEATWLFEYEAAATAVEPLIETGGDPTDYLLATGGDQFLYPSS